MAGGSWTPGERASWGRCRHGASRRGVARSDNFGWGPGQADTVASSNFTLGQDIPASIRLPVRRRPPDTWGERAEVYADSAYNRRSRTGWPLRSARDRSWRRANVRPRPPSGITIPAQSPSARGSSHASRAHIHRRGHPRQIALASSSALVVHRSGSRVHAPIGISSHSDVFIVVAPLHALRRRAAVVSNVANKPLQCNGLIEGRQGLGTL
jgi:hypothetical protein